MLPNVSTRLCDSHLGTRPDRHCERFEMTEVVTEGGVSKALPDVSRQCLTAHNKSAPERRCRIKQDVKEVNELLRIAN